MPPLEPGQKDTIALEDDAGVLTVGGPRDRDLGLVPGAGCERATERVRCQLANATAVRVLAGDGDDSVIVILDDLPAVVDLGPGEDTFRGARARDGLDHVSPSARQRAPRRRGDRSLAASPSAWCSARRPPEDDAAGRRRLRRDRDLKLYVIVRTRTGGDRGEVTFDSRIG